MIDAKTSPESHVRFLSPPKRSRKRNVVDSVRHVVVGANTVARRRGLSYYGYLLRGYVWPALMQPVVFGPAESRAGRIANALFGCRRDGAVLQTHTESDRGVVVRRQYDDTTRFAREHAVFTKLASIDLAPAVQRADAAQRVIEFAPFAARALGREQAGNVEGFLNRAHAAGVTGLGVGQNDIWIDANGQAHWTGLTGATMHSKPCGLRFRYLRNRDRESFNAHFNTTLLTEQTAREALTQCAAELKKSTPYGGWYAGIDFGDGLAVGQFLGTDNGTGRWEYLNGRVVGPLVNNKRVLDLGSNNGSMSIMMLRSGAREVVGVELSPHYARAADVVRRVFQWKDIKTYDLRIENRSMLDILTEDWGTFDVVTAFCSLYCVEEEWMTQVVKRAAELAPVMVLQANMPKPGRQPHKPRAGAAFLRKLLEENGFPHVEEFGDLEYARPLLVGRKA